MASELDVDVREIVVDTDLVPARLDGGERDLVSSRLFAISERLPEALGKLERIIDEHCGREQERDDRLAAAVSTLAERVGGTVAQVQGLAGRLDVMATHVGGAVAQVQGLAKRLDTLTARLPDKPDVSAAAPVASGAVTREAEAEPVSRAAGPARGAAEGPSASVAPAAAAAGLGEQLESLLFGAELCRLATLAEERRGLVEQVLREDAAGVGLAGRLMLARTATAEELPSLLKELGEAYYRWRPKTADVTDAFEESLAQVLRQRIATVGLRNSIELVRPGDRYDASRHTSADRGVEVAAVHGWMVLRENGKALTKAQVSLR
jgi:hypothetical protein